MLSPSDDHLCICCPALCCHYITIEIDKPRSARRKDDIRWYLMHEGVTLLIDHDRWLVKVPTRCTALAPDHTCSIYPNRPETCRDYSTENCDYHTQFEDWDTDYLEIKTVEAFDQYLETRKRKRASKHNSSPKKNAPSI